MNTCLLVLHDAPVTNVSLYISGMSNVLYFRYTKQSKSNHDVAEKWQVLLFRLQYQQDETVEIYCFT
jgi:hypothetical protein